MQIERRPCLWQSKTAMHVLGRDVKSAARALVSTRVRVVGLERETVPTPQSAGESLRAFDQRAWFRDQPSGALTSDTADGVPSISLLTHGGMRRRFEDALARPEDLNQRRPERYPDRWRGDTSVGGPNAVDAEAEHSP